MYFDIRMLALDVLARIAFPCSASLVLCRSKSKSIRARSATPAHNGTTLCMNIVWIWLAIYLFISYIVPICRLWHATGPMVACDVKFKVARHFAPRHKSLDCNLLPNWSWIRFDSISRFRTVHECQRYPFARIIVFRLYLSRSAKRNSALCLVIVRLHSETEK